MGKRRFSACVILTLPYPIEQSNQGGLFMANKQQEAGAELHYFEK